MREAGWCIIRHTLNRIFGNIFWISFLNMNGDLCEFDYSDINSKLNRDTYVHILEEVSRDN